jgi:hypothetical protein
VAPTASNSLPTGATPTSWKKWIAFVSAAAGQGGGAAGQQLNAGTPLASTGDTYQGQLYNGYTGAGKGGNPPAQYAQCGLAYCFAAADFNGGTNNLLTFDYAVSAENSTGQGGGTVEFFIAVHDSSGANLLAATATNALVPALGCQLMLFQSGKPTGGAEISCGNQDTSTIANAVNVNTKYTASFNLYNWVSAYLGGGKTWANANIAMVRIMMYGFCNGTQLGAYGYLGNFR